MNNSQPQRKSVLARIFSLEWVMAAFGLFSLGSGLLEGELMPVFWGVMILAGLAILLVVRRRDWQKHWEGLERQNSSPCRRDDSEPPPP